MYTIFCLSILKFRSEPMSSYHGSHPVALNFLLSSFWSYVSKHLGLVDERTLIGTCPETS